MGGFGIGTHGGRRCTDDMLALDVRRIQRAGRRMPGSWRTWQWSRYGEKTASIQLRVEASSVVLDYRNRSGHHDDGEWESMRYPVVLDWTTCGFGGKRVWWRCPAVGCGRRVAVLYGARMCACRQCHRLASRSQREADDDMAARRADKLRDRPGWEPGILNGDSLKPKGMHWRTFERLQADHHADLSVALACMAAKLGLLQDQLADIDLQMDEWRRR